MMREFIATGCRFLHAIRCYGGGLTMSDATIEDERAQAEGLDSFAAPETTQITSFESDELTALCPFDFGGPDHYDLEIKYEADAECLESKSLKLWLESYRDIEITAEQLAGELYSDIDNAIAPSRLYVRLEQARRGGIKETVEVGNRELRA